MGALAAGRHLTEGEYNMREFFMRSRRVTKMCHLSGEISGFLTIASEQGIRRCEGSRRGVLGAAGRIGRRNRQIAR